MGNAIWLFLALPTWYFSSIIRPFQAGPLTVLPALGTVCLVLGAVWGMRNRQRGLLMFLFLVAASQALMIFAGLLRGSQSYSFVLALFMLLQIVFALYFALRMEGPKLAAAALAFFTATYALYAAFVASMSLSDTWL